MTEKTITLNDGDGKPHTYVLFIIPGDEGFDLLAQLGEICGDSIGQAIAALDTSDGAGYDGGALGKAIGGLLSRINAAGASTLAKRLLRYVTRDGERFFMEQGKHSAQSFAVAYAGNYGELREIMKEVLVWNFRSFFVGLVTEQAALTRILRPASGGH